MLTGINSSGTSSNLYWRTASTLSGGWKTLLDSSNYSTFLNDIYVKRTGDIMTGKLTFNVGTGGYADSMSAGGINMGNSNIVGVNSIYTADASDNSQEGFHFYRDSTHVDTLYAKSGVLYFVPNRAIGSVGTSYTIAHSGNITDNTTNILGTSNTTIATIAGVNITAKVDHIKNTVTTNNGTDTSGITITIPYITTNTAGHVTNLGTRTHTVTIEPINLPTLFWANIGVSSVSNTDTEPTFKTARIKNDEYIGTATGAQCHMKYDNTNKCLDFIFD